VIPEWPRTKNALAVLGGARDGELHGLRWGSVKLEDALLHYVLEVQLSYPTKEGLGWRPRAAEQMRLDCVAAGIPRAVQGPQPHGTRPTPDVLDAAPPERRSDPDRGGDPWPLASWDAMQAAKEARIAARHRGFEPLTCGSGGRRVLHVSLGKDLGSVGSVSRSCPAGLTTPRIPRDYGSLCPSCLVPLQNPTSA
jgi:hypothetical protein